MNVRPDLKYLIIGLSGYAHSGKDTVADLLVREHGFTKIAIADPLKRIAQKVYDFTDEQLWGPSAERNRPDTRYPRKEHIWNSMHIGDKCKCCGLPSHLGLETEIQPGESRAIYPQQEPCFLTTRYALQTLGSEWGRNNYPGTWIELLLREIADLTTATTYQPSYRIVIPDCRFINEFEALQKAGGKLVRVKRPTILEPPFAHGSETEQRSWSDDKFDTILLNDGTLGDLPGKVTAMLQELSSEGGSHGTRDTQVSDLPPHG